MELPREYDLSSLGNTTFRDGLTIQEVINILENNAEGSLSENEDDESSPNTVDIYITPGEPSVLTDQDSADEDTGGTLDNLCGRQLLADAEIRLNTRDVTDKCLSITDYRQKKRKWIDGDLTFINTNSFEANTFEKYKNLTCAEMFEIFFDDDCIKLIKDETTKYAAFLNKPDPNISINEIRSFIGILLLSGYNTLPGKKFYWDTKPDIHNTLVSGSMRRDRFIQIMKFMHLADNNNLDKNDKFFKLRPLINHMKKKCIENFIPHENISYDEAMIKYYGKHSCKQYIKGKPIRFGYKAWCLNTDYGYLINFDFYQGKNPTGNTAYENLVGKAAAPLLTMLDELPSNKQKLPYVIFFDNLFTGFNLLNILKQRGYFGTGTIRENRILKDCPLPTNKEFKKASRGSIISSLEKKSGVFVTKWKDNAVVAAASTAFGKEPEKSTKRYSQKEKKIIHIKQPNIIRQYNKYMGGTDRMDEDLNDYRIGVRGKKFWWPLFTWLVDLAVNNSWVLYKKSNRPITKLEFRREIVLLYLSKYRESIKSPGVVISRPSTTPSTSTSLALRYDDVGHYVAPSARRRCALRSCTSQGRTICVKCNVGLCVGCFIAYHKNK